ncbi:hypothetical protein [Streptomyces sp. NPDC048172]|uniref:hypothetical protein n=1 Tax=Streptomyces sp. NPDC048172 TaxID=3365505 RepID=UPI00371E4910
MATTERPAPHSSAPASSVLAQIVGAPAWREAGRAVALLPASVTRLSSVPRGVCGVALGLFGWTLALFAGQATVNGVLYPLVDAHDYQHSWGGPTLIGAWLVHALVAVPVVVGALGALRGVVAVDRVNARAAAGGRRGGWWTVPLSAVLAVLAVLLINTWLNQL